jgi:hypothetical protein
MNYQQEIIQHTISKLKDINEGIYGCDLHNELFNTDYYVIGYHDANKSIEKYGGAWKAIARIKSYEMEMFGECYTDLSDCEKVANMLAYIEGEVLLMEASKHLEKVWDDKLTIDDLYTIWNELENY